MRVQDAQPRAGSAVEEDGRWPEFRRRLLADHFDVPSVAPSAAIDDLLDAYAVLWSGDDSNGEQGPCSAMASATRRIEMRIV